MYAAKQVFRAPDPRSQALETFLAWFGESISEDASLEELTARAVSHFSIFATYRPLVRDIQSLRRAVTDKEHLTLDERESVRRSYYTARNIYAIVLGEIPRELA